MSFSVLDSLSVKPARIKSHIQCTVYISHYFRIYHCFSSFTMKEDSVPLLMGNCLWFKIRNGHGCVNRAVSHSAWNVLQLNRNSSPPAHTFVHLQRRSIVIENQGESAQVYRQQDMWTSVCFSAGC